jgi:glutathione synthase
VPRPATLITRSLSVAEQFTAGIEAGVVVKPARSCGGRGVTLVRGRRRMALLPDALAHAGSQSGDGYAVVQEYLPEAAAGEKRLLWLDGRLLGGYLRMRAPGEFRHNLKVGGLPEPCPVTDRDQELAATLTPHLRRDGIWFAGIDVIGGRVVEVNTLNPGGAHYTSQFTGLPVARQIIDSLTPTPHPARHAS